VRSHTPSRFLCRRARARWPSPKAIPMHPQLLHQLADDSVLERRRHHQNHRRRTRRTRPDHRFPARLRLSVGGLLIAAGTRLAGTRAGPGGGLQRQGSA
jgi:hypothetical protein